MQSFHPPKGACALFFCLTFCAASGPASAADGVREINQACVATGCFPGDGIGFPVSITAIGSYILTSNLDVRGADNPENVTAIDISTLEDLVTVDLNGFSIIGPTICTGGATPTACEPTGSGVGIDSFQDARVTITNGKVSGMGGVGVRVAASARIEGLQVESCGGNGIQVGGSGGLVLNNISRRNAGDGFWVGSDSLVLENVSENNIQWGIAGNAGMGYGHNVINDNSAGTVTAGVQIANNLCDGVLCP